LYKAVISLRPDATTLLDDSIQIDGFQPISVVAPQSIEEVGELIRRAVVENHGLYPVGGATGLHFGATPSKAGHAIDLRGLNQLIDYPARDMTVTVRAGITIGALHSILSREDQRLPVDVPHPNQATLGGAIAVNASGPRRFGFGTLRDYVIGISFMTDNGVEAKAGGRVVKNVAGYDLCKLHVGALGTLGIITQITLKLRPSPQSSLLLASTCRIADLPTLLERIHNSQTRPTCIEVEPTESPGDCRLTIGFEESEANVRWQVERLSEEIAWSAPTKFEGETAAREWRRLTDSLNPEAAAFSVKARMLPSSLPAFFAGIATSKEMKWQAHAGNGIVFGHSNGEMDAGGALRLLNRWRELAAAGRGDVIVTRCSPQWKQELRIWGAARGDLALMRSVKNALDPKDLFNPGRLFV
jgi:glycolate oxidase FAD binding subunit